MDQFWRKLKRQVAANRQAPIIDVLATQATTWVLALTPTEARRKAGMLSDHFWLKKVVQDFWLPTWSPDTFPVVIYYSAQARRAASSSAFCRKVSVAPHWVQT